MEQITFDETKDPFGTVENPPTSRLICAFISKHYRANVNDKKHFEETFSLIKEMCAFQCWSLCLIRKIFVKSVVVETRVRKDTKKPEHVQNKKKTTKLYITFMLYDRFVRRVFLWVTHTHWILAARTIVFAPQNVIVEHSFFLFAFDWPSSLSHRAFFFVSVVLIISSHFNICSVEHPFGKEVDK